MTHDTIPDIYTPKGDKLTQVRSLWRHMRRLEGEGAHPAIRQAWELILLRLLRGIGPFLYLRAGLYRREISWKEKLSYVGGSKYDRLIHSVNPPEYDYLTSSKLETYRILTANSIPMPPVYGVVEGLSGWTWDGTMLRSPDDLVQLLERLGVDTVCFKYVSGCRGRGFYKVKIDAAGDVATAAIQPGGEEFPLAEFWETLRREARDDEYFCQGVIDQHPDITRFNPWSVNTVRTWMVRSVTGEWKLTFAILRMGAGEVAVDNMAAGGISALIDNDSGRLSFGTQRRVDRPVYTRHPVTGVQIDGTSLSMWADVKSLCHRTAELFPQYCLLAVDIAFGKDGPMIVELGGTPDDMQGALGQGVYPLLQQLLKRRK